MTDAPKAPHAFAHSINPVPAVKGGVFALGNFDGVHRGHQAVIKTAIEKARGMGIAPRVLTLEPHPRSVFKPGIAPFRLTPEKAKIRFLHAYGIEDVIVQPFNTEFSQLPATDFVEQILVRKYGAQHIIAGFDFVFGHNRGGNMKNLREWLTPYQIGVTEVTPFRDAQGEVMSSSRVRECLQQGDMATATNILGRPWSIAGVVQHGSQRGRQLSVPTANITLGEYQRPKYGVYAVNAGPVGQPLKHQGVANIGLRPTVDGKTELLEFHMFNFFRDIYGEEWEVELVDFIRPEQAFPNIDALKAQIERDIETAKAKLDQAR